MLNKQERFESLNSKCSGVDIGTHHFLAASLRGGVSIVPYEQYDQEQRQHVELPVPHCEHEDLKEKTGYVSERAIIPFVYSSLAFGIMTDILTK